VEQQGRRALQLSSGEVKGMFGGVDVATGEFRYSAVAITVYVIIVLVLLWPLIFALVRKLLPPKAAHVVEELAHDAEAQVHDPEAHTRKEML
jgi:hypothetical protein